MVLLRSVYGLARQVLDFTFRLPRTIPRFEKGLHQQIDVYSGGQSAMLKGRLSVGRIGHTYMGGNHSPKERIKAPRRSYLFLVTGFIS